MTLIAQRAARMPITLVEGADFSIGLAITENGVAYPWAGATVVASILDTDGTPAAVTAWTFTPGVSGAAIMSLTDTQTTTLGVGTFLYSVEVTKAGITTPWLGGQLSILDSWNGGPSNSTATFTILTAPTVTVGIEAFGWGSGVLTVDGNLLTRAAGAPAEITRANLAADTAFTSRYMSVIAVDSATYGPGVADATAHVQALINAQAGVRKTIFFPPGTYLFNSARLDVKKCNLLGAGLSPNGGYGTTLTFTSTYGIYSSTEDNTGFSVSEMTIFGSGALASNGQILLDFTGQNGPHTSNVRLWQTHYGMKLAKGASIECNYGVFNKLDLFECTQGITLGDATNGANSHTFVGGRYWTCTVGAYLFGGTAQVDNVTFVGTAFEVGNSPNEAVKSAAANVGFVGCRFESGYRNVHILANAGAHHFFGGTHSAGTYLLDDNTVTVARGLIRTSAGAEAWRFGGPTTLTSAADPAVIPLIVKAAPSQAAGLAQFQDSAGTMVAQILNAGGGLFPLIYTPSVQAGTFNGPYISMTGASVTVINRVAVANVPMIVQGMAAQTGNLQEWRDSGSAIMQSITATGAIAAAAGKVGFYGTAPIVKPAVTGSRAGNAALASLLTQLVALGILTDSSTA